MLQLHSAAQSPLCSELSDNLPGPAFLPHGPALLRPPVNLSLRTTPEIGRCVRTIGVRIAVDVAVKDQLDLDAARGLAALVNTLQLLPAFPSRGLQLSARGLDIDAIILARCLLVFVFLSSF